MVNSTSSKNLDLAPLALLRESERRLHAVDFGRLPAVLHVMGLGVAPIRGDHFDDGQLAVVLLQKLRRSAGCPPFADEAIVLEGLALLFQGPR